MNRDRGAVLVEYAVILPVVVMLGVSALFYGLAMVNDLRLTHAVTEATHLHEDDAAAMVSTGDGTMTCFWSGTGPGGCFDDGLDIDRTQVMGEGRTWHPPLLGSVTPRSQAVGVNMAAP